MSDIKNELTWSPSRAQLFQECQRAYYHRYYGSWGGWNKDADDKTRLTYILKNMTQLLIWAGSIVHDTIRDTLRQFVATGRMPTLQELQDQAVKVRMRNGWAEAVAKQWETSPKKTNFFELYYGDGNNYGELTKLPREVTDPIKERVLTCLEAFFFSPVLKEITVLPTENWKTIDQLDAFFINTPENESIKVWCAPDFAYVNKDDKLVIIDWKTGNENPANLRMQLACYALFAMQKWNVPLDKLALKGIFLRDGGRTSNYQADKQLLDSATAQIIASRNAMFAKLHNPEDNLAREEDFPCNPSPNKCNYCIFKRLCLEYNS